MACLYPFLGQQKPKLTPTGAHSKRKQQMNPRQNCSATNNNTMSSSSNNPNLLTTPKGKVLFAKLAESVAELEGKS